MTPRQWRYAIPAAIRYRRRTLAREVALLALMLLLAAGMLLARHHILAAAVATR
jgi:hypothetical protein